MTIATQRLSPTFWLRLTLAALLVFACLTVHSQPAIDISNKSDQQIPILPYTAVLEDPSRRLTVNQIPQQQFQPLGDSNQYFFRPAGSYWFRFSLHNTQESPQHLWLECDNIRLDSIELYTVDKNNTQDNPITFLGRAGGNHYNPAWEMQERLNMLRLDLAANETREFYLRVENSTRVRLTVQLHTDHSQMVRVDNISTQQGVVYGILITLFIYTLNIYLSLRDRTFLYFVAVIIAVTLQTAASQGAITVWIPGNSILADQLALVGTIFNLLSSAFFIRGFLSLALHNPILDKIILATGSLPLLFYPLHYLFADTTDILLLIASTAILLITALASGLRIKQGYRPAVFPLIGSLFVLVPMTILYAFPTYTITISSTTNLYNLCMVAMLIMWACGMGSRIDNINKQLSREVSDRKVRESQLIQAQSIARYGDWSWDINGGQFFFSDSAQDILPTSDDDHENNFKKLMMRAPLKHRKAMVKAFDQAVANKQGFQAEFRLKHDDGSNRYYLTKAEFQRNESGATTSRLIGTLHDITDKKLADIAFRENEQRWHDLADSTFEAILIYQNDIIIDANQACEGLLGHSPQQLIGSHGELFMRQKQQLELSHKFTTSDESPFEFRLERENQQEITVELRIKIGNFNNEEVHIVAIRDISERKQYEHKLRQLGYYDNLTGLANRSLFQQRLQHAIEKSGRTCENHALLFIDLDRFKNINDSLGHDIGDQLLIEVAHRLKERSRKSDTVARLGGDEFAIFMEDISAPYFAAKIADDLLEVMSNLIKVDDYQLLVTPSIGIAMFPADGDSTNELLRKADTAMYHAKSEGRNNYQFYTEALNEKITRRMDLESELRLALVRDELFLEYQPKVNLFTGEIVGAEALLRWHSEKYGSISPAEFIPIAEETGLIWPIGELVLNNACKQACNWIKLHPAFESIAVNISGIQFNHTNLVEIVAKVLEKSQIPAHYLELEITENAVINNAEEAIEIMKQLKQLGVRLSLDDFGTGYSSLSYLKRFPVDSLKIDQSFVAGIVSDKTDLKIADNIVKLAHDLSLNVVAEGVESKEQLSLIRAMGCDELQGYIFSKPLNDKEMNELLTVNKNLYSNNELVP